MEEAGEPALLNRFSQRDPAPARERTPIIVRWGEQHVADPERLSPAVERGQKLTGFFGLHPVVKGCRHNESRSLPARVKKHGSVVESKQPSRLGQMLFDPAIRLQVLLVADARDVEPSGKVAQVCDGCKVYTQ